MAKGIKLEGLQKSLEAIAKAFSELSEKRETVIRESRDVLLSCSKAIVSLHQGKGEEAKRELRRAKLKLRRLHSKSEPELIKHLIAPEQEFVEASALEALVNGHRLPSMVELGVSPPAYLLGMLDFIGEVKRLILDKARAGEGRGAVKLFDTMEELYVSLMPFAIHEHLAPGLRRKLDMAKSTVESVRTILTEKSIIDSLKEIGLEPTR